MEGGKVELTLEPPSSFEPRTPGLGIHCFNARNTFYWIILEINTVCYWNLASLCHISKGENLLKHSAKTATFKLFPDRFVFAKNQAQLLLENEIFETSYLCYICISKAIKICSNQHIDLLISHFSEDSLKIKDQEIVSSPHFN